MVFQADPNVILWRLRLRSSPSAVFSMISTDEGRTRFWAESTRELDGKIHFIFPNGFEWDSKILKKTPPHEFSLEYIDGSVTTFQLQSDGNGGTNLILMDIGVPEAHRAEVIAGWISVLMNLKAAVDFSVDLRNHDPNRTWDQGYVDN
ncbi:MAG: SRPBCC domain-containing protein [Candidatus Hermodarchaeota archaeon]